MKKYSYFDRQADDNVFQCPNCGSNSYIDIPGNFRKTDYAVKQKGANKSQNILLIAIVCILVLISCLLFAIAGKVFGTLEKGSQGLRNSASLLEYGSGIIPESLTDTEYQELQLAENESTIVEQEEENTIAVQEEEYTITVQEEEYAIAVQEAENAIAVQEAENAIAVQEAEENAIAQQETEENRPETEIAAEQKRQEEEAATAAALKDEEQGQAEKAEQEAVYAKRGDYGDKVRRVQQDLITLHYILGTPDGEFGGVTESAVRAFQADNNYEVTGILTKAQSEDMGKQAQEEEIRRKA